jgi:membrane protein required for colicin V production
VTKLDYIVFVLLALSAVVGFARGAVREIAAMVALVAAAVAALLGLKFVKPVVAHVIHTPWMASVCALIVVFGLVYVALRLAGAALAERIHSAQVLGALDRTVGLLIGFIRGLVVLGALYLMFNAATPEDLRPRWIVQARSWPIARDMGGLLERLAPKGLDLAGRLKPSFARVVQGGAARDRTTTEGYDARQRREIDDLVERSR